MYIGLGKWKIKYDGIIFELICRDGIKELIEHIDRWRAA